MIDKLENITMRYEEILNELNDPAVASDHNRFLTLMKEQNEIGGIVEKYNEYKEAKETIEESLEILDETSDEEFRELAKEELNEAKDKLPQIEEDLKVLLIPKDPNDAKNVIVEIRSGAGGDEAALFGADLYRMYTRYAERQNWKVDMMSLTENGIGGFKDVVFMLIGKGVYSRMKYESGVHRVQRVPTTESGGRIHTSTATVAIMPEAEEVDVELDMNDCRIDVFRSSGNGGQSVNTTDSAVRITHIPTGIVVSCQDEKSQLKNKDKALKILRSKLYDMELEKAHNEEAQARKSQVGTGDRSEKIRTYNFPQGRVTDHRIKLTLHQLDDILDGDIDEIVDSLITADQATKLSQPERVISSINNRQIKHLNLLQKKARVRKEEKAFVIEGIKMFEESRKQGNLIKSYFSETFYNSKYEAEPEYFEGLSYEIIHDSVFNKVAYTSTPQGVLAIVEKPNYQAKNIIKNPNSTLLVLENIQDPGNLGTMIRTAEGAGFTGIILSDDCVDILNPKVIRSTMGAIYRMPYAYARDEDGFHEILKEVKNNNITIFAAHLEGAKFYDKVEYQEKCAILIGNESNGLKEETAKIADGLIKIPMKGKVESLNAAVAAAVIMYEVARQRRR